MYIIPAGASACMGLVAFGVYKLVSMLFGTFMTGDYFINLISVAFAIFAGVLTYAVGMVRTKGVTEEELMGFPKGSKLVNILKKTHIMKTT